MSIPSTLGRAFAELPQRAKNEQTGVVFVGLLFSIAIGFGAEAAAPVVLEVFSASRVPKLKQLEANLAPAALHYAVAFTLTITSFIGYYTSTNVPRLQIKFFNYPFVQFALDVSMVVSYFLAFSFVETRGSITSAAPESWIVFISFLAYVAWDVVSWRIRGDTLSQLALGSLPYAQDEKGRQTYSWRRWVTVGCSVTAGILVYTAVYEDLGSGGVIVVDSLLIALILGFRLLKSLRDSNIRYRGEVSRQVDPLLPVDADRYGSVLLQEWLGIVPEVVASNIEVLLRLYGKSQAIDELLGDNPDESLDAVLGVQRSEWMRVVDELVASGAAARSIVGGTATISLTRQGHAYVTMYPDRVSVT